MIQDIIDEADKSFMGENYFKGRSKKMQTPLNKTEADLILNSDALDIIIDGAKKVTQAYAAKTGAPKENVDDFMSQVKELVMRKLSKGDKE